MGDESQAADPQERSEQRGRNARQPGGALQRVTEETALVPCKHKPRQQGHSSRDCETGEQDGRERSGQIPDLARPRPFPLPRPAGRPVHRARQVRANRTPNAVIAHAAKRRLANNGSADHPKHRASGHAREHHQCRCPGGAAAHRDPYERHAACLTRPPKSESCAFNNSTCAIVRQKGNQPISRGRSSRWSRRYQRDRGRDDTMVWSSKQRGGTPAAGTWAEQVQLASSAVSS